MPRASLSDAEIETFRRRLCEAAMLRIADRGYAGVTLRGLAADLGCSPMTPYRYFRDKEEIFSSVRTAAYARFADAQESAARGETDPVRRLVELGTAYLRFARAEPHAYRIIFELDQPDASGEEGLAREAERAWQPLHLAVEAAVRSGEVQGDPTTLAHVFWAGLHGLVALHLAGRLRLGRGLEALGEPMMNTLLRGNAPHMEEKNR